MLFAVAPRPRCRSRSYALLFTISRAAVREQQINFSYTNYNKKLGIANFDSQKAEETIDTELFGQLYHFEVTKLTVVNGKAYEGAHLVESVDACGTRVNMESA